MIRLLATLFANASLAAIFVFAGLIAVVRIYGDDLPSHEELRNYRPKMLTRVYSGEGEVIAEYARERRVFVPIDEVPEIVKQAFISAEDKNFYSHPGIDIVGIAKAITRFAQARIAGRSARLSGASTITQQVMKNFLVGDERSVERKIKESILAVRVGGAMSKDQILELYLNDIYLGARSYGVVAAAENYFGKTLEELEPHEAAYLAALPKAPSDLHPIRNRQAALDRRNYVLREMAENGVLRPEIAEELRKRPIGSVLGEREPTVIAAGRPSYFTEEVRRQLLRDVGEDELYHGGLTVRATVDYRLQEIAERVLRKALEDYDRGLGEYRGPVAQLPEIAAGETGIWRELLTALAVPVPVDDWRVGVVLEVGNASAVVGVLGTDEAADGRAAGEVALTVARERQWLRRTPLRRGRPQDAGDIWQRGDVVLVTREDKGWALRQVPEIQGAFMAMDPHSGRVLALQGGFAYETSAFNRATQALRQPGSSFKPFVYAAALDVGYTPDTIVLDAPIKIGEGRRAWEPKNSSGNYSGPTPLRTGLVLSRNLMTVRIAQAVGMDRIGEYAERFGVYENMPPHLSYALGAGETTLYQLVAAYGMFANGGKRVIPTVIDRVQDRHGITLFSHDPRKCQGCKVPEFHDERTPILFDRRSQIMDPLTAYQLVAMMQGVIDYGTASRTVGGLGFPVAGKTGTTNDNKDAWFVGFTKNLVAGCFIGYDTPRPMGRDAFGGTLCGPVFRQFMKEAYDDARPGAFELPGGNDLMVTIKYDALTGERLPDDAEGPDVVTRTYMLGTEPEILVSDVFRIADDVELFSVVGTDLVQMLPEGDDVPLSESDEWRGSGEVTRDNVGLGTGGLY